MLRLLEQLHVVNVRRHDLVVAALAVLALDEVEELVVDAGAVRQPECGTKSEKIASKAAVNPWAP